MNADILERIYKKVAVDANEYSENAAYVKGKNPEIYREKTQRKPDNRLPIPFAKMVIDDLCGYSGRADDIEVYFELVDVESDSIEEGQEDDYRALIRRWMDYNNDGTDTSELYREALSQGKAFQLWWTSEDDEPGYPIRPEYKIIPGDSVFVKYSADVKPVKEYAVRFWKDEDDFDGVDDQFTYAMVYYPLYAEGWRGINGSWSRYEDLDTQYPYTKVPVIEYKANKDGDPIFEAEKRIIDQIDKIISKSINEVDRFNALILLLPALADAGFVDKLTQLQVMDDLDRFTKNPEYLQKDLAGVTEFYKWIEELLEDMFRKSIKIPDMTDEAFGGGDESGVARAFKMLGMEFVASQVETYFNQGIYERKQMFDDVINSGAVQNIDTDLFTIVVKSHRNLPVDEKGKVEIAMSLKGIISDETLMRFLPNTIVPDVDKEIQMLEDQRESNPLLAMIPDDEEEDDDV
jgi:SPP1 family phage portal protein